MRCVFKFGIVKTVKTSKQLAINKITDVLKNSSVLKVVYDYIVNVRNNNNNRVFN